MLIQYKLIITAIFPAPGGNAGVGCLKGQEEKAGCIKSLCLVLTNPPQFQVWGKKKGPDSCAIAVLQCCSGQWQH